MRRIFIVITLVLLAAVGFGHAQSAVIVKQVNLTNQTAYISPTLLVMPKSTALYRVSAYFEVLSTEPAPGDGYFLKIGWTDASPSGMQIRTLTVNDSGPVYSDQMTMTVSAVAGKPLGFSVTDSNGVPPAVAFNVYITVEQLQ